MSTVFFVAVLSTFAAILQQILYLLSVSLWCKKKPTLKNQSINSLLPSLSSLSAASFPSMPTCAGIYLRITLLSWNRIAVLSCSCLMDISVDPDERACNADGKSVKRTMFCCCSVNSIRWWVAALRACT